MNLSDQKLFKAISSFQIDEDGVEFSFSDRLARENQWSALYSKRAISEYKKFIYLCCVSDKQLTPSDQVDQVWHLHLTYTRSYWTDMCRQILKKDFHHGPTRGGEAEGKKYRQQYLETRALYKKEFRQSPPEDIWPDVSERFKNVEKFIRINESNYWLIQKPSRYLAPVLLFPFLLMACTNEQGEFDFWFFVAAVFGIYIVFKIVQWLYRNDNGKGGNGGGCGGCAGCGGCGG